MSKADYYIKTNTDINSKQIAQLFFNNIFKLHGIPDPVVSYQGTQFISVFTWTLVELVGILQKISIRFNCQGMHYDTALVSTMSLASGK